MRPETLGRADLPGKGGSAREVPSAMVGVEVVVRASEGYQWCDNIYVQPPGPV
ncbi:MAG: hypothetical protein ACKOKG_07985 [Verrucomicrobiota bacterium]